MSGENLDDGLVKGKMKWIKKLFDRTKATKIIPSPKIESRAPRHEMTLERWQKDDALVNWARRSDEFAYALATVINQQPSGFPARGQVVTDIQCAVELGRKEGYADCEAVLLALRQFPAKPVEEVEADYDNTEYPESKEG